MSAAADTPGIGKISTALLASLLAGLPPLPPEVRLGPRVGEDACAIDVPDGVLVAAADPVTLTADEAGAVAVMVNANDVAVTGARPRWFLAVILVPPGTSEADIRGLFRGIGMALDRVGAHLVGGHTEVTPAVTQPIVVGQMLGLVEAGSLVPTGGIEPGDVVVQVGPTPIEGAAVLAREAAAALDGLDGSLLEAARSSLDDPGISVVEPALLAARLGATALHDPTEGGLAAGLHELALASRVQIGVDRDALLWFRPGTAVCRALAVDPLATLASGTLLATFPPASAETAVATLAAGGLEVAAIGTASAGSGVVDAEGRPLAWPERDEVARLLADR